MSESTVTIHADSTISVGGTITGYCVRQTPEGTRCLPWHNNGHQRPRDLGSEVKLSRNRFALSVAADLKAFEAEFLAAWVEPRD